MKKESDFIPNDYKKSSLGIIPNEWNVKKLGDLVSITSGESPSLYLLKNQGKYPYVKVEDMNLCEKYQNQSRNYSNEEKGIIKKGSIIFPKRGAAILNNKVRIAHIDIQMDSNMMAILPKKNIIWGEYLYYNIVFEKLFKIADTSTIPQINNKHIIPYKIPLPPLPEQQKIAKILGTWDKAIEMQTQLIKKLELRKKGLMQHLLTGKKRLPGFSGEWRKVKLGKLFIERNEINKAHLPLLSITADRGVIFQSESDKRDISNDDKSKYKHICPNDIGYNTMRMWQGRCALSSLEGIVSPAYTIITPNKDINPYFMEMLFKQPFTIYCFWTHSQGLVNDTLNCKFPDFSQIKVTIPNFEEQNAISQFFKGINHEIELCTQKLNSLLQQKKGLMQVLLTGKKRINI